jgi:hypothetical protein
MTVPLREGRPPAIFLDGVLMADATAKLPEIELYAGRYWFTRHENGKGTLQGPFVSKHEAETARKKYLEETGCQETPSSLSTSTAA